MWYLWLIYYEYNKSKIQQLKNILRATFPFNFRSSIFFESVILFFFIESKYLIEKYNLSDQNVERKLPVGTVGLILDFMMLGPFSLNHELLFVLLKTILDFFKGWAIFERLMFTICPVVFPTDTGIAFPLDREVVGRIYVKILT